METIIAIYMSPSFSELSEKRQRKWPSKCTERIQNVFRNVLHLRIAAGSLIELRVNKTGTE